jgi:hypothetical protein
MTPKLHKVTKGDKIGKKVSFYNDAAIAVEIAKTGLTARIY